MPALLERNFAPFKLPPGFDVLELLSHDRTFVQKIFFLRDPSPGEVVYLRETAPAQLNNDAQGVLDSRICFVAGTPVRTCTPGQPVGPAITYASVENIAEGDGVVALNEKTHEVRCSKVQQTFIREADRIYWISLKDARLPYGQGTKIGATWSHPFYVVGEGYIKAKDLRAGDMLLSASGENIPIERVEVDARYETVYNFSVEEDHNYFVSESEVLVHNEEYPSWAQHAVGPGAGGVWLLQRGIDAWRWTFGEDEKPAQTATAVQGQGQNQAQSGIESLQQALQPGQSTTFAGDDGLQHRVTLSADGKTRTVQVTLPNGQMLTSTHWNREGQGRDKQFLITEGPETNHPAVQNQNGTYRPSVGELYVNDKVHGAQGTPGYPTSSFHSSANSPHADGHNGTDVRTIGGRQDLRAAENGLVTGLGPGYNTLIIRYQSGYTMKYMHISGMHRSLYVGASVTAGQYVGRAGGTGGTGNGYPPHLHLEVRRPQGQLMSTPEVEERYYGQ